MQLDLVQVELEIMRSLWGAVHPNMRAISFDYTETTLSMYVYIDCCPNDELRELIDCAITEVMASIPQFIHQEINLISTKEPIGKLNAYKGWIFVRYEKDDFD